MADANPQFMSPGAISTSVDRRAEFNKSAPEIRKDGENTVELSKFFRENYSLGE